MTHTIATIVEGDGDVAALPIVIRLIDPGLTVPRPIRFKRSQLIKEEHLSRSMAIARSNIENPEASAILLMIDADEDCPAELGPRLLGIMQKYSVGVRCFVSCPIREFEAWIAGGHPSLDLAEPESAGKLKERIRAVNNNRYRETIDQPRFASQIDVEKLSKRSHSFDRLVKFIYSLRSNA